MVKSLFRLGATLNPFHDPAVFLNRPDGNLCSTKIDRTDCDHADSPSVGYVPPKSVPADMKQAN